MILSTKIDEFRHAIKLYAYDQKKSVVDCIHTLLDDSTVTGDDKQKVLPFDNFEAGLTKLKDLKKKLNRADLRQIFDEIDEGMKGTVTVDKVVAFCQKNIPAVRALALKLRQGITEKHKNESGYRKMFDDMTVAKSKFADLERFLDVADDVLDMQIDVSDGHDLYLLYDMDGDGKVSVDDFIGFVMGNTAVEGLNALKGGLQDAIVDVKISVSPEQDAELQRCGYLQVTSNIGAVRAMNAGAAASQGTFGRGQSMWVWRRSQGVCSGRLKPVVNMYLDSSSTSSALVLSGFTCVNVMVANQWLWLKRASDREEEKDAIVDICVTVGRAKLASDPIHQSPGVGYRPVVGNFARSAMLFGGVDAFVWFKPARTPTDDRHVTSSPLAAVATMSEETRVATLLLAARRAIRHFVPLTQMQRLAKLQIDADDAQQEDGRRMQAMSRSDRLYDYSALYQKYEPSGKGQMTRGKLQRLLHDVGARMDPADVSRFFYFFNTSTTTTSTFVTRGEFNQVMLLTDHEVDLVIEDVRKRLLPSAASSSSSASAVQSLSSQSNATTFREGRILSGVFQAINSQKHNRGVLSLDEIMAMAAKLEIFLTEAEAERIFALFDGGAQKDGKVTEADFIGFMKKRNDSVPRKASRVRDVAGMVRRWLSSASVGLPSANNVGGIGQPLPTATSSMFSFSAPMTSEGALEKHWQALKKDYERLSGQQFLGYLGPEHLTKAVAMLHVRISTIEAHELALMIAPEKRGRIQKNDLAQFMTGGCRYFGELIALLERDLLKPLIDAFAKLRDAVRSNDGTKGASVAQLQEAYEKVLKDLVSAVQGAVAQAPGTQGAGLDTKKAGSSDVVSVYQLKTGIELAYRRRVTDNTLAVPDNKCPSLEEWVALACLVGADVCVEDAYGVKVQRFLEGVCLEVVGGLADVPVGSVSLDVICQDLKLMLIEEAKAAAVKAKKKGFDFDAVFSLFDEDRRGTIDLNEFKHMLGRLQLINQLPESQIPALLARFDKDKKGKITKDDFIKFVGADKKADDDLAAFADDDDFDDDDYVGQSSNKPPEAITSNADGDWLIWFLWREACKVEPTDPESVVTELEAACAETLLTQDDSLLSLDELWAILCDLKLRGTLTKEQFKKHAEVVKRGGRGGGSRAAGGGQQDMYDFEALCRYTVRMGRAYNKLVQEKRIADNEQYAKMKVAMQKALSAMISKDSAESKGASSSDMPRFEKVFRRMDSDGDGLLTMQEFKVALKKLRYEEEKKWTMPMIRRLFNDFDSNQDGLMSVREFSSMIQDYKVTGGNAAKGYEAASSSSAAAARLEDDEDDRVFSRPQGAADSEIFRKVNEVLQDVIVAAVNDPQALAGGHAVVVQREVRRYFQKHDPDATGTVTEERFRSFCRRSGLQDRLTVAELRRLVEKLRRRRPGKDKAASVVDYEKVLHHLTGASESIPHSRSEAVLQRLQEAAASSASFGRPFLSLCSLVDHRLTGRISREDLLYTAKMMECVITNREVDALRELYPSAFSKDGQHVDYRELSEILVAHTPRQGSGTSVFDQTGMGGMGGMGGTVRTSRSQGLGLSGTFGRGGGGGALPSYVSQTPWDAGTNRSSSTTVLPADVAQSMLATPAGFPIATPYTRTGARSSRARRGGDNIQYAMESLAERVGIAVAAQRTRGYSLMGHFEELDRSGKGFLSFRSFEAVLYEIGADLEGDDVEAVAALFGDGGDFVDYGAFCNEVNDVLRRKQQAPRTAPRTASRPLGRSRDVDAGMEPTYGDRWLARAGSPRGRDALSDNLQRFRESVAARDDYGYGEEEDGDGYGIFEPKLADSFASASILGRDRGAARGVSASASRGRVSKEALYDDDVRASRSPVRGGGGGGYSAARGGRFGAGASTYLDEDEPASRFDRSLSPIPRAATSPTRGGRGGGIPEPSMSPTKMGAIMWGKDTPLVGKGKVPSRGGRADTWCCAVCMYVENPLSAGICQVCDSPNYTVRKDFQVKEQCRNCTFLNGQFAKDCEMCGEPLSGGQVRGGGDRDRQGVSRY